MIRALPLLTACVVLGIVWPPSAALPLPHLHSAAESDVCVNAAPATNFTNKAYEGTWFEIAKYQTAGGAFFERNCVCTEVEVAAFAAPSLDYSARFSCRDKTPNGKYLNFKRDGQAIRRSAAGQVDAKAHGVCAARQLHDCRDGVLAGRGVRDSTLPSVCYCNI